jgi:hypothetical protein
MERKAEFSGNLRIKRIDKYGMNVSGEKASIDFPIVRCGMISAYQAGWN